MPYFLNFRAPKSKMRTVPPMIPADSGFPDADPPGSPAPAFDLPLGALGPVETQPADFARRDPLEDEEAILRPPACGACPQRAPGAGLEQPPASARRAESLDAQTVGPPPDRWTANSPVPTGLGVAEAEAEAVRRLRDEPLPRPARADGTISSMAESSANSGQFRRRGLAAPIAAE